MNEYSTIVIGLGAAGTTAATELARAGKSVLALEAQDRIGGRVYTYPFGDGLVELGAEWIHGTENSRVYEAAIKNNVTVVPQYLQFEVFRSDGQPADSNLTNELMMYCIHATDGAEKPEPLGDYITGKLMDYIRKSHPELLQDKDYVNEFLLYMELLVNNHEASDNWNDANAFTKYTELEGHQHMSWHRHGYRTFFEILLNTFNGNKGLPTLDIKLNTEVTNINWPLDPASKVEVETSDGTVYKADNVIVTVSVGVLKSKHKTLFTPALPKEKILAIETIPIGIMDKIILSFAEPWWPEGTAFLGFLWKGSDRKKVSKEDFWTTKIFGASTPMGSANCLTLWTSGNVAKMVETLPEDVVRTKVVDLLQRFLGHKYSIPEPTEIMRSKWATNPFTQGSYSYDDHKVVANPNIREVMAQPLLDNAGKPRVLFAGEATDDLHFSTVHGATDSGLREAKRLLTSSKL